MVFPKGERSYDGLFRQSRWSGHNEVKQVVVHIVLVCLYIFLSCHFICSNTSYCWVFLVANFLSFLIMYHLITFQLFFFIFIFWKKRHYVICNQHQFFFFYWQNQPWCFIVWMVQVICKAYSKQNRNPENNVLVHVVMQFVLR